MADLVLEGADLRTGQAEGVRLPGQGGADGSLTAERAGGTYTTAPLQSEFPCTHIGVHWRTDGEESTRTGVSMELRASRDGQTWTSWRRIQAEGHGPDRQNTAETFGALAGVRLSNWFQARLTFAEAGPAVTGITLTCLDSRRLAETSGRPLTPRPPIAHHGASPLPQTTEPLGCAASPCRGLSTVPRGGEGEAFAKAGPVGFLDRVITREAWGADESLRFNKDGQDNWLRAYVVPSLLVVHHTATDGDITDAEADVRAIYAYHAVTQGWGDIGYHLLIDSSGRVYEGRRGREPDASGQREIVTENVVAGHALDYNYGSVGIALIGNYQERQPGQPMLDTLVDALSFMAQRSGIDPTASISYPRVRSDGTVLWRDGLNAVSGHRDCIPTECPGENVYGLLPDIRQRVEAALGARGPAVRILRGPSDRNAWPGDLAFAWETAPSGLEVSTRLAGWVRKAGADTIVPLSGYTDDERPDWGPWTRQSDLGMTLPPDARGVYSLFVRARDAAGQVGRVVARWHLAVDRHVVVDDTDAVRTRHEGDWERSHGVLGYYGTGYQAAAYGQPDASFYWRLAVPEDGTYQLQASWTEAEDRTSAAAYLLSQGGQTLGEATANQQEPGGRWVALLDAPLAAGAPCTVGLTAADDGATIADAVRLVKQP